MKFTIVFTTLLCVSTTWTKQVEESKDKREAQVGYGVPATYNYQAPASYSQGDASAISVGAGYSIGGQAKPTYSFNGHGSSGALRIPSEGLSPNGHATIQLAPITLQPGQFAGSDLSQIMSQLSHSLNAGGLSLQPSTAVAEFHQGGEGAQGFGQGQELLIPQFSYGGAKYELSNQLSSGPSYSTATKGLNSYSGTGPVLFNPEPQQAAQAGPSLAYNTGSSGQSLGDASGYSLSNLAQSLGSSGHSFGGSPNPFGGAGHSLSSSGHSAGSSGHALGGSSGHSLGGSGPSFTGLSLGGSSHSFGGSYKPLNGAYAAPSKNSFKPSTFLGASVQGESGHGISSLSGSYGGSSLGSLRGVSHGNGLSIGAPSHSSVSFGNPLHGFGKGYSKYVAPVYQSTKSEGLDGASSLSGHYSSPPATTYGSSFSSNSAYGASSTRPVYVHPKYRTSANSFSQGSSAYRAPAGAHNALHSYSSGPKYGFGEASSSYEAPDAHGSASETTYNTIKYSEPLKPHVN